MTEKFQTDETLAERLAARLRELARNLGPGARLPAETVLAEQLDSSLTKVREALTLLAREGWVERRQGSGTYVAERWRARPVGIFSNLDLTHGQTSGFFRALAHELRECFRRQGIRTQLYLGHHAPGDLGPDIECPVLFEDLERGALAGLIVISCPSNSTIARNVFCRQEIPVLGRLKSLPLIFTEHHEAMVMDGLRYLVASGCRRLAMLGWNRDSGLPQPPEPLLRRYREALGPDADLHDRWIRCDLYPTWPGSGWEEFREIWSASPTKPDGLLVTDDNLLPDLALALGELGVEVPRQLRVAALTNAGVSPRVPFPLACIEIDPRRHAEDMGRTMLALLQGKPVSRRVRYTPYRLVLPVELTPAPITITPSQTRTPTRSLRS